MRREADFFGDTELVLIYMARRLRDALRLEELLTDACIDFAVETGTYSGGLLFRRELTGAFFYVQPEAVEQAIKVLLDNRYQPYKEI
jgi:hypothetical protein